MEITRTVKNLTYNGNHDGFIWNIGNYDENYHSGQYMKNDLSVIVSTENYHIEVDPVSFSFMNINTNLTKNFNFDTVRNGELFIVDNYGIEIYDNIIIINENNNIIFFYHFKITEDTPEDYILFGSCNLFYKKDVYPFTRAVIIN